MPHHNRTLPADQDQRIINFLTRAYADSRLEPKPEPALRRTLGYLYSP